MNVKKIAIAASLLGIISGSLVGCTNGSPDNNTATNTDTNTSAETKTATGNGKLRSVAFTVGDLSNPFFVLMGQATEAEAKKIGGKDVNVTVVSSAYDLNQQANQIENFTASNFDTLTDVLHISMIYICASVESYEHRLLKFRTFQDSNRVLKHDFVMILTSH